MSKVFEIDKLKYSIWFFTVGIILFSGSLYLLSINSILGINTSFIGPLTPLGGLLFIIGCSFGGTATIQKTLAPTPPAQGVSLSNGKLWLTYCDSALLSERNYSGCNL